MDCFVVFALGYTGDVLDHKSHLPMLARAVRVAQVFLVLNLRNDARGGGLQSSSGWECTASCPQFTSCYVLLPTLYLVPACFLFPFCGPVLLPFYICCTLASSTHLVRSPTLDHLS
ncbi:hypothetical protein BDW66DRAFT_90769 [Aspergillus desertorum]